ncbi:NUC091 domain-domain-containing protein [Coniella lustricola]|uniref:Nucleolar GTP-binding protein 2 n=1 Tax=Coniella lustricola TaxID=2025994 RepID=A0A2T3A202_9PEZI|nr:NUC091 domain-domain-containing protein [Coniella lustricola]
MGGFKKEANRRVRDGTDKGGSNFKIKGENFYRTAKKVKQLNILKEGKPERNADGKIIKAATFQSRDVPSARVEPNRKWFSNSRVISQESLSAFRDAIAQKEKDPYTVLLKSNKLPLSLIRDGQDNRVNGLKQHQAKMTVETSPFSEVFGPKSSRKRVKLSVSNIDELANDTVKSLETYHEKLEEARLLSGEIGAAQAEAAGDMRPSDDGVITTAVEPIFSKGQSKRIWNELYKVIDSSDVILHVLDARDPLGTRCRSVEKYLREEAPHKHLVFILNKCDLVPTKVAAQWVKYLQKDFPTAAFRASINNPFGKGSLITLLRQFSKLHSDRKQVSVGLIGYPNTGKSSIINTLRGKKVATTAPIPGETKVWQYVTLMKRIYLIDCPGIVPQNHHDAPKELLLRGVVRVENVEHPEQYIPAVLQRVKKHHMARTYNISDWNDDHIQFLELLARKGGRLLKGGEPDVDGVAKMVLNDFMRGKIPWFIPPPTTEKDSADKEEDAAPVLKKRKRTEEAEEASDQEEEDVSAEAEAVNAEKTFEGFGSDSAADISDDSDSEVEEADDAKDAGGALLTEDQSKNEDKTRGKKSKKEEATPPSRRSKRLRNA